MKALIRSWVVRALALMMAASAAFAQDRVPFRQEELDQMLAPIALYPDPVLSQILMASTYPLEVVQAARWSRANSALRGQDAVRAAERMDWDPSVKSLTAFPQILHMMDEKLEWTERLGEAFLAQQADVMDAVQELRRRAEAAGNLESGDRMQVGREGDIITIQPPAPNVVYVPYYDPRVVYGPWWWNDYPPVYWAAPRAYYAPPPYPSAFFWGTGIGVSAGFFFGYPDWHRRHVTVVHRHVTVVNQNVVRPAPREPVVWRHNPEHRRGVPFRNPEARVRYEQNRAAAGETHRGQDRYGATPLPRRTDEGRPRRLEERASPPQQQRAPAVGRIAPEQNRVPAPQPPAVRSQGPVPPAASAGPSRMQPDPRSAQPEARFAQPEQRAAPQAGDPRRDRSNSVPPSQARSGPPQAAPAAPPAAPDARGTRPDPRAAAAAPQQQRSENNQRRGGGRDQSEGESRGRPSNRDR